jgi:hypothetical protein
MIRNYKMGLLECSCGMCDPFLCIGHQYYYYYYYYYCCCCCCCCSQNFSPWRYKLSTCYTTLVQLSACGLLFYKNCTNEKERNK